MIVPSPTTPDAAIARTAMAAQTAAVARAFAFHVASALLLRAPGAQIAIPALLDRDDHAAHTRVQADPRLDAAPAAWVRLVRRSFPAPLPARPTKGARRQRNEDDND